MFWPLLEGRKMIDSYDFGRIVISGKEYTQDVIIYPTRVDGSWWRKEGHKVYLEDIREILKEEPEVLIVGTGYSGLVKVLPETEEYLKSKGIKLIVEDTRKACQTYNKLCKEAKAIAAFHLTC